MKSLPSLVSDLDIAVATASAATRVGDRIKVTRNTTFERINGFGALRVGMNRVEATVKRSNGRWVAIDVERSGRRARRR